MYSNLNQNQIIFLINQSAFFISTVLTSHLKKQLKKEWRKSLFIQNKVT